MDTWLEGHTEGEAEDGIQNNGSERRLATKKDLIVIQQVRNGQVNISQKSLLFGVHGRLRIGMNQGQMKYCLQDVQKTKHG
jgi:hypothetical protein